MTNLQKICLTTLCALIFAFTMFATLKSDSPSTRGKKQKRLNATNTNSTTLLQTATQYGNDNDTENSTYPNTPQQLVIDKAQPLQRPQQQRVVLLVGPHKTSSSSVQTNIIRWAHERKLPGWVWPQPTPDHLVGIERCNAHYPHAKIFYPFFGTLNGMAGNQCLRKANKDAGLTNMDFIRIYEDEFRKRWDEDGMSLVIGSEAMDFVVVDEEEGSGDDFMSRILQILPWNSHASNILHNFDDDDDSGGDGGDITPSSIKGSNDDITVVVKLRTPRTDHLISLWHQCCMDNMNFYEYLTDHVPNKSRFLHSLDSFRIAQRFLDQGLKVILIDMQGANDRGFDISNVIACDVLNATCSNDKQIVGKDGYQPSVVNVKSHSDDMLKGISGNQIALMEKAIRNYDCNFRAILRHEYVTLLYSDHLTEIFDGCDSIPEAIRIKTRHELGEILRGIAVGGGGEEEGADSMINE